MGLGAGGGTPLWLQTAFNEFYFLSYSNCHSTCAAQLFDLQLNMQMKACICRMICSSIVVLAKIIYISIMSNNRVFLNLNQYPTHHGEFISLFWMKL